VKINTSVCAFSISFVALAIGAAKYGVTAQGDYLRYIGFGNRLWDFILTGKVDPQPWINLWVILYLVPNLLISGGNTIFGVYFPAVWALFNIFLYSSMTAIYFQSWDHNSGDKINVKLLIVGLGLIFGLSKDILMLNYWVLSDILFLFTVAVACYYFCNAALYGSKKHWRITFAVSFISIFIRPVGLALFGFISLAALYMYLIKVYSRQAIFTTLLILLPAIFALILWPYVAYQKSLHNGAAYSFYPDTVHVYYESGMVVAERPELYLPHPEIYLDYVHITINRLFYYFYPLRDSYSEFHNVYLVGYIIFLFTFMALGRRRLIKLAPNGRHVAMLLVLSCYYYGLFHSMLFVEDFRYQLPSLPSLWLLAGYGAAELKLSRH